MQQSDEDLHRKITKLNEVIKLANHDFETCGAMMAEMKATCTEPNLNPNACLMMLVIEKIEFLIPELERMRDELQAKLDMRSPAPSMLVVPQSYDAEEVMKEWK